MTAETTETATTDAPTTADPHAAVATESTIEVESNTSGYPTLKASTLDLITKLSAKTAEPVVLTETVAAGAAPAVEPQPAAAEPVPSQTTTDLARLEQLRVQLDARQAEVDARAKTIEAVVGRRSAFADMPLQALREQVADWLGVPVTDPAVRAHLLDVVTEISSAELGVVVDSNQAERETRRLSRKFEQYKQEQRAAEEKRVKETEEATKTQQRTSAVTYLDGQLQSASAKYPALNAIDAPGAQVLARVEAAANRGEKLSWEQAAEAAEREITTYLQRFQPLFVQSQATSASAPAPVSKQPSTTSRIVTPSLRNSDASTSVGAAPREQPTNEEEAKSRTIERLRALMQRT